MARRFAHANGILTSGGVATTPSPQASIQPPAISWPAVTLPQSGSPISMITSAKAAGKLRDVGPLPLVHNQPTDQTVVAGTATAVWERRPTRCCSTNGSRAGPMVNATAITFSARLRKRQTINNVEVANVGTYSVIVGNAADVTTGSNAQLSIIPSLPVITIQPANLSALPGRW